MSNPIMTSIAMQQSDTAVHNPNLSKLEKKINEKGNLSLNLEQPTILKRLFIAPLFNGGNILANFSRANNAGSTEKVLSYKIPDNYKPGAAEGNFSVIYENGLSDQSMYSDSVLEILNNPDSSDLEKFNTLISFDTENKNLPSLLKNAIMADVKGLSLGAFLSNSANNNFSEDEAKKGIGKLMHGALDLILKLRTLSSDMKISLIKEMNLLDNDELQNLAYEKNNDSESMVFHILAKSPYKIRQVKSKSEAGSFIREYYNNPNAPHQRILKADEGSFGGITFSVSYDIPKSKRSAEDIKKDIETMDMNPNKTQLENMFKQLSQLSTPTNQDGLDSTREALTKTLSNDTETSKDPVEQLLIMTYDNYSEPFRKTTSRDEFLEILSKNLSRRVESEYTSTEPKEIIKQAFKVIKEKEMKLESTLEAALYETTQAMKKSLQGKLEYVTNPENYSSPEEYTQAQREYESLDPVLKSDATIEKENEQLFRAAFGRRINGRIPFDQLTTQTITIGDKTLKFLPEQDSSSEELRMPSGVVVNIKGAQHKPSSEHPDSFYTQSNGEYSISASNGFVKMTKNGKLVSMITPNGVRLNINENHKHAKDAYTLMSANRADGARANNHFNGAGPTYSQRQDAMNSSQRKLAKAKREANKYSYGISNHVPNKIINDSTVTQAFSPYGDAYTWNPMGNAVLDITSSFFDTRQSKLVKNKTNIKQFNKPDRPIDYNGNNFNTLAT